MRWSFEFSYKSFTDKDKKLYRITEIVRNVWQMFGTIIRRLLCRHTCNMMHMHRGVHKLWNTCIVDIHELWRMHILWHRCTLAYMHYGTLVLWHTCTMIHMYYGIHALSHTCTITHMCCGIQHVCMVYWTVTHMYCGIHELWNTCSMAYMYYATHVLWHTCTMAYIYYATHVLWHRERVVA